MNDLTVIIVSWNCKGLLHDCLHSLEAQTSRYTWRTVVIDNGSADGTVAHVRKSFPGVEAIENRLNNGFAAANNQVLTAPKSRYVMLLNPDTVVQPGALDGLVGFMEEHPGAWVAGPTILNPDGTLQRTGVRFPNTWNIFVEGIFLDRLFPRSRLFGRHRELYLDPTAPRQVDYLQGACLIVRSEAVRQVGSLDERFFLYFEETDWCYRMKAAGGEVWRTPRASVVHLGGGELGHYDERRVYHYNKSLLLFYNKHYAFYRSVLVRGVIALRSIIRFILWSVVGVVAGSRFPKAFSSAKGYLKSIPLMIQRVP
jgi:hypothetical protein